MRTLKIFSCTTIFFILLSMASWAASAEISLIFPPEWLDRGLKAKNIASELSIRTGLTIQPVLAESYPEIIEAFSKKEPVLGYFGSFVHAILYSRNLCVPVAQGGDGHEFYNGIMIVPRDEAYDPFTIIERAGTKVAFCYGTSSGEGAAKAASKRKAALGYDSHQAVVDAVRDGTAKAAFVKNWWWEENKARYEDLKSINHPIISSYKHPDNILCVSRFFPSEYLLKFRKEIVNCHAVFGVKFFYEVRAGIIEQTFELLSLAGIDPVAYKW